MNRAEKLHRLRRMAGMVLELRAASLAKAAAEREAVRERLAALNRVPDEAAMADMTEAQRFLVYEAWAAGRRTKLNQQLARQEVIWRTELAAARQAFGRDQVLAQLQEGRKRP
ncbi:hypothetical protein [Rhodobacter sp. 24-YEA-8]|uniref:hypothetical protein n=1 Tax=Rhodobacter sp. 24-YEA-8 TaxID=1884310 RepID=UPI0008971DA0|nr:hypothetical protein [Rhodobacter sp. 24-YEA-8]SEC63477.1 hypothetical protein SAMN05519105_2966 [Rhodobacter sp. 24-YEA-8]